MKEKARKNCYCSRKRLLDILYSFFPILHWFPRYDWKLNFVPDLLAGITVGVVSVPQGMAFARIAGVSPINGLYINFIPTLVYAVLGTSHHAAIGRCALVMGMLRLGFVSVYLSDQLVGGFTTGIAVHVLSTQVPALFGLVVSNHQGAGQLLMHSLYNYFQRYPTSTGLPLLPFYSVSNFLWIQLPTNSSWYGSTFVGEIPAGFPVPHIPRFDLMEKLVLDTLILAIVAYSLSVSLSKMYAKKHNYKINPYQEFFAYSGMNIVGSFFQCWPASNSTSRILIYEGAGAKSQLAAIIGTLIVVITILFIAPYLEPLPNVSLRSSMIVVACIFMLRSLKDLKPLWKTCKIDFSIYLVTFLSVVLLDVSYGLAVSVLYAFFTAKAMPGIKVFHFTAPLYYANVGHFKPKLYKRCGINPELLKQEQKAKDSSISNNNSSFHHVVLDCSGFSYVDLMGVDVLKQVYESVIGHCFSVTSLLYLATVRRMLEKARFYDIVPRQNIFITLHDAVLAAVKLDRIHSS
ncbi:Sulfate permease family protein 3 [Trichuris trichiura]|uniref:Sulfate permease family protein 3 n=1 Tax=Trichuris trichiura TaxID=36087 RepID=A0A077Z8C4_TRITR|nr:Sulfate permease family protein 3 [Trichuris trichiura]